MTLDQIRDAYNAQPFSPFVIHLADGREVPVLQRDFIMITPSGRTVVVMQPTGRLNIIDVRLVTDLEMKPNAERDENVAENLNR